MTNKLSVYGTFFLIFSIFFIGCTKTETAAPPEGVASKTGQKSLKLDKTETSDADLAKIAEDNPDLAELTLGETKVQNLDEALLSLKKLRKIRVSGTDLTSAGVTTLSKMETLEDIDLSRTNLGDMDLMLLANLPNLKRLNLYTTKITNFGLDFLKDFKSAGTLVWLNIDKNSLDDAAVEKLAPLTNLEWLHLGRTALTDKGLEELAKIKTLKEVSVTNTKVSKDGVAKLQSALPNCKVNAGTEEPLLP